MCVATSTIATDVRVPIDECQLLRPNTHMTPVGHRKLARRAEKGSGRLLGTLVGIQEPGLGSLAGT